MAAGCVANPWAQSSTCLEYKNTIGNAPPVTAASPIWKTLTNPPEGASVYEALSPGGKPNIMQNHVIVHPSVQHLDEDVEEMAKSAAQWDHLSGLGEVPGMSSEKVVLVDLQGKAEYLIVQKLNPVLKAKGFMGVDHISVAIYRTWDKAFSKEYRDELKGLLVEFFGAMLDSAEKGAAVIEEWPTVMDWRCQRVAFAQGMSDNLGKPINAQKLAILKEDVLTLDVYRDVRNAAFLLLKAADSLTAE